MAASFARDFTRRDFLKFGLAGALGVSFSGWLPRLAQAAQAAEAAGAGTGRRSCILLWMNGGPAQTDTFDLKPGHKNGGPFKQIETAVPGVRISEHLPGVARQMRDLAIIRGLTSREGDHGRATELMMTGYRPTGGGGVNYPVLGSIVARELGRREDELPNFVSISPFRFANLGAGFLGPRYAPLTVSGQSDDPAARANLSIENLAPPGEVTGRSLESRFGLLKMLHEEFGAGHAAESVESHAANYERAMRMVRTQANSAFKLDEEDPALRDAYGRNRFGQGCLLARRLVERGVAFVEVTLSQIPGNPVGWDTHVDNFNLVRQLCEVLDPAWSTLMDDLRERGLLDSTLVVWMGEFGRTPTINNNGGRDHYPAAWSTVLGGGGVRGGQALGATSAGGEEVTGRPVTVPEFFATMCAALGIDPSSENVTEGGRPIAIVDGHAKPVAELVGA